MSVAPQLPPALVHLEQIIQTQLANLQQFVQSHLPPHWEVPQHGQFSLSATEGSVVDFDPAASLGGKITLITAPPSAPPASDAVVSFDVGSTTNVAIEPINGASIALYNGSFHQAVTSGVNPTTLSYTSQGFDFTLPANETLMIHTNDGHYLAIGDVVQTTGLNVSFDYAFYS